jgi:hypothetical protein
VLLAAALSLLAIVEAASASVPSALQAFMSVCAASPTMQSMEAAAKSNGWTAEVYPDDIRAGFLAEQRRQRSGASSLDHAEIYSRLVNEGRAYLIVSRSEPLFGSKLPVSHACHLAVYGYKGETPRDAMSKALGVPPTEPWSDELGNEVLNWYVSQRFPLRQFQVSRIISKTSLAGPADLSGLAISVEFSENRK